MSVFSVTFGMFIPSLLNKKYTDCFSGCLYFIFGLKLLYEYYGNRVNADEDKREVEMEIKRIEEKLHFRRQLLDRNEH